MLTRKQHELLMFIHERIKETGVSPSFDEMKEALDLASKSGIHRLITALEERGFLRRLPHRARALEVVKLPQEATTSAPPKGRQAFKPQLVAPGEAAPAAAANDTRELSVLGKIAAGTPIEAIQQERDRLHVPESMLGAGEHFVLEVQGDSMINAGILDGDYVVIRRAVPSLWKRRTRPMRPGSLAPIRSPCRVAWSASFVATTRSPAPGSAATQVLRPLGAPDPVPPPT